MDSQSVVDPKFLRQPGEEAEFSHRLQGGCGLLLFRSAEHAAHFDPAFGMEYRITVEGDSATVWVKEADYKRYLKKSDPHPYRMYVALFFLALAIVAMFFVPHKPFAYVSVAVIYLIIWMGIYGKLGNGPSSSGSNWDDNNNSSGSGFSGFGGGKSGGGGSSGGY